MTVTLVTIPSDVYFVCLNHAMTTDNEETVGLLVGEIDIKRIVNVVAILILRRSDKRKDRVEISPEQLSNASTEAEKLASMLNRPVRIIGWYHSHPKLTCWPSNIDVNTQSIYQMMDVDFIGIIFSVFNEEPTKKGGRIQMTCYQSQYIVIDGITEKKRLDVPVKLIPTTCMGDVTMKTLCHIPRFLCQEEQVAYNSANRDTLDYVTRLHNSSVHLRAMGQIAEVVCAPFLKMLEERLALNESKRRRLQEKRLDLRSTIAQFRIQRKGHENTSQVQSSDGTSEMEATSGSVRGSQIFEPETAVVDSTSTMESHIMLDRVPTERILFDISVQSSPTSAAIGEMTQPICDVSMGIPRRDVFVVQQNIVSDMDNLHVADSKTEDSLSEFLLDTGSQDSLPAPIIETTTFNMDGLYTKSYPTLSKNYPPGVEDISDTESQYCDDSTNEF